MQQCIPNDDNVSAIVSSIIGSKQPIISANTTRSRPIRYGTKKEIPHLDESRLSIAEAELLYDQATRRMYNRIELSRVHRKVKHKQEQSSVPVFAPSYSNFPPIHSSPRSTEESTTRNRKICDSYPPCITFPIVVHQELQQQVNGTRDEEEFIFAFEL